MTRYQVCVALPFIVVTSLAFADYSWNGHIKYQPLISYYDSSSFYEQYFDSPTVDHSADARFDFQWQDIHWGLDLNYQLLGRYGDSVRLSFKDDSQMEDSFSQDNTLNYLTLSLPDDSVRIMNLTHRITGENDYVWYQRFDRATVSWVGTNTVVKLGRQAISWGNGLLFNPMDIFNPFDPAAVDKEYKAGNDMLYSQYLLENGNDLQLVWVGRRDSDGDITDNVSSFALKYHGFYQQLEYDFLISSHYEDTVAAVGVVFPVGGAIVRSDIVATDTSSEKYVSFVVNWSYSWVLSEKNVSATFEYFRNGFGIEDSHYSPAELYHEPELLKRLSRGESYNLGQDYLAATATIEAHPLWLVSPNIFYNINDKSAYLQVVSDHDLAENLQLTVAASIPMGTKGSEYGGAESGIDGVFLSTGKTVFMQIAWYF